MRNNDLILNEIVDLFIIRTKKSPYNKPFLICNSVYATNLRSVVEFSHILLFKKIESIIDEETSATILKVMELKTYQGSFKYDFLKEGVEKYKLRLDETAKECTDCWGSGTTTCRCCRNEVECNGCDSASAIRRAGETKYINILSWYFDTKIIMQLYEAVFLFKKLFIPQLSDIEVYLSKSKDALIFKYGGLIILLFHAKIDKSIAPIFKIKLENKELYDANSDYDLPF